jgi:CubicO group peptidase (beta-lactamase class C family)
MQPFDERRVRVQRVLSGWADDGRLPGTVVLIRFGDDLVVVTTGNLRMGAESPPVQPDAVFRIASITKPITAMTTLRPTDEGLLPFPHVLMSDFPELANSTIVRTPSSGLDDVVPLARPMTLEDLLTSRNGWGFPTAFDLPAIEALFAFQRDGTRPHAFPHKDAWITALSGIPMVAQPGS